MVIIFRGPIMRTLRATIVNIALVEHSQKLYVDLLKKAHYQKQAMQLYHSTDRFGFIRLLSPRGISEKPAEVHGVIKTFVQLESNGLVVNTVTGENADENERRSIQIPKHLGINGRFFRFVFYPKFHLMVVETYNEDRQSISPKTVGILLDDIFSEEKIKSEFGDVAVTVVPERDALSDIFKRKIKSIEIDLKIPNPGDGNAQEEKDFAERMKKLEAQQKTSLYKAASGKTIKPDKAMKVEARMAVKNGQVKAKVIKDGAPRQVEEISTKDMPLVKGETYDPKRELAMAGFERLAKKLVESENARPLDN
jgi:hypothetical protein